MTLFAGAAFCPPAFAKYELCNETTYIVRAALAHQENQAFKSFGWFDVFPGYCRSVIDEPLDRSIYFVHARTIAGHHSPTYQWSGDHRFCVGAEDFDIGGDEDCERRGFESAYFARINVSNEKSWTTSFTEPSNYSAEKAKIMGVQRLLADLGFLTNKQIDGYWGRGTERAILRFARQNSVNVPSEPSPELFGALMAAANKQATEQGLELCNSTSHAIWAAIGLPNKKGPSTTKGWYEIEPAQCLHTTTEPLDQNEIFVYAETVDSAPTKIFWRGDTRLCTNDVMFSISTSEEICEDQGYILMGFEKISTEGAKSFTHTFRNDETSESSEF